MPSRRLRPWADSVSRRSRVFTPSASTCTRFLPFSPRREAVVGVLDPRLADAVAQRDAAVAGVLRAAPRSPRRRCRRGARRSCGAGTRAGRPPQARRREVARVLGQVGRTTAGNCDVLLDGRRDERLRLELLSTSLATSRGFIRGPWRGARRAHGREPGSGISSGRTLTARPTRLSTSTRPSRSRISPRGASTLISRTRLLFASARYLSPDRIWRYQSRKKMIANMTSAKPPMTATRNASCGVIGGRLVGVEVHQDLEPPQADRAGGDRRVAPERGLELDQQHGPQEAPADREERQRDQRVEEDRHEHLAQHEDRHRSIDREHERHGGVSQHVAAGRGRSYRDRRQPWAGSRCSR